MESDGVRRALVGWSGFVGGVLSRQVAFDARFRRDDVDKLADAGVDEVVCVGAPAAKWQANQRPDEDWANIERLAAALRRSGAARCVLVSTVDVYADSAGADEDTPPDTGQEQAYGRNRARLEGIVRDHFRRSLVVRLPGLFGPGLRKNLLYDLLHQPEAGFAHRDSAFQFYDARALWGHILVASAADLPVVNLPTEPVTAAEVARVCFDRPYDATPGSPVAYDLRTKHAMAIAGRDGSYLATRGEVLAAIRDWATVEARRGSDTG